MLGEDGQSHLLSFFSLCGNEYFQVLDFGFFVFVFFVIGLSFLFLVFVFSIVPPGKCRNEQEEEI